MAIELRLPNITGVTEKEQLLQIKSYLYQLSQELQYAFETVIKTSGTSESTPSVTNQPYPGFTSSSGTESGNAQVTFAAMKSLIIKSADIVNAYYAEINKRLEGVYVAQSDFGKFAEKTSQEIEATSKAITQTFENTQVIIGDTKEEIYGELNVIGEDLSYAQEEIITLNRSVEDIDKEITTIEVNISELDTSLKNSSGVLGGNIDNALANASALAEAAEAAAKGYTDDTASTLQGQISEKASELEGQIVDANSRIDDTNSTLSDLGSGLADANKRLEGAEGALEAAKSDLSSSIQRVAESVSETDKLLESARAKLQGSIDDLEFILTGLKEIVIGVTAYVKSGLLYYTDAGVPVYGIEIGQEVETGGEKVFHKFSRFTSEKLSFYDQNGIEVAYISDNKLYIKQAEITISLKVGGIISLVLPNGDVVKKWVGKE
jgi:predicted  nucleic acid-binding Zn-ribbon protein